MLFLRNLDIVNDENIIVVNTEINQILSNEGIYSYSNKNTIIIFMISKIMNNMR